MAVSEKQPLQFNHSYALWENIANEFLHNQRGGNDFTLGPLCMNGPGETMYNALPVNQRASSIHAWRIIQLNSGKNANKKKKKKQA